MLILPASTAPPAEVMQRAHEPKPARWKNGYREYRACLRWDFGFTCPFCLQHETDIVPTGAEGHGVTSAEHLIPQSESEAAANEYENCLYCCKRCNRDRSIASLVDESDRRLLDPTRTVWADHFAVEDDEIRPVPGDADAEYTVEAYKPNRRKKVLARKRRRGQIGGRLEKIRQSRVEERQLVDIAGRATHDAAVLLAQARRLRLSREEMVGNLVEQNAAVPTDAPSRCRCETVTFRLPGWLASQCQSPPAP